MKKLNKEAKKEEDKKIISGILSDNEETIRYYFYEKCKPIFRVINRKFFFNQVDERELISELYIHLSENDWYNLRTFDDNISNLKTWTSTVAHNLFKDKKIRKKLIKQVSSSENIMPELITEEYFNNMFLEDMENLLKKIKYKEYRFVIQKVVFEGYELQKIADEMGIAIDDFYTLKSRALKQFRKIINNEGGYAR